MRYSVQPPASERFLPVLSVLLLGFIVGSVFSQALPAGDEAPASTADTPAPTPTPADNDLLLPLLVSLQARVSKLEGATDTDPFTFRAYWKNGLRFTTRNKAIDITVGGRIQIDAAFFDVDQDLENISAIGGTAKKVTDQAELRRARLNMAGTLYDRGLFKIEVDFAGDSNPAGKAVVAMKDVYAGLKGLPAVGTLRIGHFKEFFGLEELTSDLFTTFLERGFTDAFAPSYNLGIGVNNTAFEDRLTYAIGVFRDVGDSGNATGVGTNGKYNWTARITGLPLYVDKGAQLIHFGLSVSLRNPNAPAGVQTVTFSYRPEAHLAPNFVNTGAQAARSVLLISPELVAVVGSVWFQAEYVHAALTRPDGSTLEDATFSAFYVAAGFFLTGETRPYKNAEGVWDRVQPLHNLFENDGSGAWELIVRFSAIDLEDTHASVYGGTLTDITAGFNWYLNPNLRFFFNYVHATLDQKVLSGPNNQGSAEIAQFRVQADF